MATKTSQNDMYNALQKRGTGISHGRVKMGGQRTGLDVNRFQFIGGCLAAHCEIFSSPSKAHDFDVDFAVNTKASNYNPSVTHWLRDYDSEYNSKHSHSPAHAHARRHDTITYWRMLSDFAACVASVAAEVCWFVNLPPFR